MTEFEPIYNLADNYILRALLKDFCIDEYQENAETDDEHIIMEYNMLGATGQLHLLLTYERTLRCYQKLSAKVLSENLA